MRARPVGFYPLPSIEIEPDAFARGLRPYPMARARRGLVYVHVPFCTQRCSFCRFYAGPYLEPKVAEYTSLIMSEMAAWGRLRAADPEAGPVEAVFFGGGTPSALTPEAMRSVVGAMRDSFPMVARPEITFEWYPKDADDEKFVAARESGVSRVSFGIQTWDAGTGADMGTHHGGDQVDTVLEASRRCGMTSINIDLMANVPGQSLDDHLADVGRALAWRPDTLSINPLELMEGTPLAFKARKIDFHERDHEKREWLDIVRRQLWDAGYRHQRARNFVRSPYVHRYNRTTVGIAYDIVPIGPGAYGFYGGWPVINAISNDRWVELVRAGGVSVVGTCPPDEDEMRRSFVSSSLIELAVDTDEYYAQFGTPLEDDFPVVERLLELGAMERAGGVIRLTADGMLFADDVCSEFFSAPQRLLFDGHLRFDRSKRTSQYFPIEARC